MAAAVPALAQFASQVFGMFSKAHAQAVANEANALNGAVPAYVQGIQQIFQAVNSGQLDLTTAQTYIDGMVDQYYAAISPIMKKGGPCVFNQPMPSLCNGPCSVGCSYIERISYLGKQLLSSGQPGSETIQGLGPHAGFQGAPTLTLTLTPAALQHTTLTGTVAAIPTNGTSEPVAVASVAGTPVAANGANVNFLGMQIPRSTALLVGGGLGIILLFALIGGSSNSQPQVVVVPPAGA